MGEASQIAFWEHLYEDPAAHLWGTIAIPAAEIACDWIRRLGGRRVLDAGCGDGRNLLLFCDVAPAVVGSDVARAALRKARLNLPSPDRHRVILARDDIRRSLFADESFDVVVCLEVLSHVERADRTLRQLMRLVAPGGVLITDVFTDNDSTRSGGSAASASHMYSRYYDRAGVESLCAHAFAVPVSIERTSWMDPPHPGVRDYAHRHETWTLMIRKMASPTGFEPVLSP